MIKSKIKQLDSNFAIAVMFFEKPTQTIELIKQIIPSGIAFYLLNNGSSQFSSLQVEDIIKNQKKIKYFKSDVNLGVSNGRNLLIENIREDWILFLDNDILPKTVNWTEILKTNIKDYSNFDALIPRLFNLHEGIENFYPSIFRISGNYAWMEPTTDNAINWFPGGATCIKRSVFSKIGLYEESMFIGGEDYEFAIRAIIQGKPLRCYLIDDLSFIHDHRKARTQQDIFANQERYCINTQYNSFNRIFQKHGIVLENSWKEWSVNQMNLTCNHVNFINRIKWKSYIPNVIKNIVINYRKQQVLPRTSSLYLSSVCNFRCQGCLRSESQEKMEIKDITIQLIREFTKKYPSIQHYTLAGFGEPTFCPDFSQIVDYLKLKGKHIGLITNGSNLKPILECTKMIDYISISLYGYDRESYQKYTRMDTFDTIIENYYRIKEKYPDTGFSWIATRDNYKQLEMIIALCDAINPSFLRIHNYLPYSSDSTKIEKIIRKTDLDILKYIETHISGKTYASSLPTGIDENHCKKTRCFTHNYLLNLDGNGNIGGCQRQKPPSSEFGNIYTEDNPFLSFQMKKIREGIKTGIAPFPECKYCFGNYE